MLAVIINMACFLSSCSLAESPTFTELPVITLRGFGLGASLQLVNELRHGCVGMTGTVPARVVYRGGAWGRLYLLSTSAVLEVSSSGA